MRKYSKIGDILDKKDNDQKKPVAKKIIIGVIALIAVLVVLVGAFGYNYVKTALQPLDRNSNKQIEVKIPVGSTNKQIGAILEEKKVIKSGFVFDYYVRTNKLASFKAGYYELKPSMSLATIAKELQKGGASQPLSSGKVLVKEGVTIDEIGDVIAQTTKFKKQDFLALVNDESFLNELKAKYPELLTSALEAKDVRYRLEGYLYPATYAVQKNETLKQLVEQMVAKTNEMLTPYYTKIKEKNYTVQQVLTLASLVEREGVTTKDRYKIAGVFENRLEKNMKIQSDISVLYALGKHKQNVTYKDLEVDSPYNLYKNEGMGPGPFNNPSIASVKAVLDPIDKDKGYLYFIANMKTGKVYFSKTYAEHQELTKELEKDNQ
ncbi:endolytic transglycosylase MltG [Ligilactobacillus faecis]|uniref:endolytic transglycosylase MltG n=1 Tax=Ligilactobacillus faecis TaxID=762833 RepID=UPI002469167A|nr:endolytic transglycosylase MltG [Ligilactobacillus faecis]WGN89079.1 endolytic transglycosylase MltG [Ligilactobacillus faecis]